MGKFPVDAPKRRVIKALGRLGFRIVREAEHIAMLREQADGTRSPLTSPSHSTIKASTLRTVCQSGYPEMNFWMPIEIPDDRPH